MADVLDEELLLLPLFVKATAVYYTFGFPEELSFVGILRLTKDWGMGHGNMTVDIAVYRFMYASGIAALRAHQSEVVLSPEWCLQAPLPKPGKS